jgi:hypothetical protein
MLLPDMSPSLILVAAALDAALIGVLVVFQLCLAAGVPWGRASYGGATPVLPTRLRVTSAIAAPVWALIAFVVMRRAGYEVWAPLPDAVLPVVVWVVTGLLVLAVIMHIMTRSRIERAIWLPVVTVMLAATAFVAIAA